VDAATERAPAKVVQFPKMVGHEGDRVGNTMNCPRGCVHGYTGTDEIPLLTHEDSNTALTLGRIWTHVQFKEQVGDPTRVRLCRCQTDPQGEAELKRRDNQAWRLES
jgi:hypothetical protein